MDNLIIASTDKERMRLWLNVLSPKYPVIFTDNIDSIISEKKRVGKNELIVLDADFIDNDQQLSLICQHINKVIVVGENLTATKQIEFIYGGARGYSDKFIDESLILRAIQSVINNEIWLKRQLVPQMLKGLVVRRKLSANDEKIDNEIIKKVSILTRREIEVIEHVYNGEDNAYIAEKLNITMRTVKAHLSSIYRKLGVIDRFQLVVFLKDMQASKIKKADYPEDNDRN